MPAVATTSEARHELYQALKAHKFDLEITRGVALPPHLEIVLVRRIEAAQLLLEWLEPALEPGPQASPEVQTPTPSSAPADQRQTSPSAPDHSQVPALKRYKRVVGAV
jgi:hypothetical protein